TQVVSRIREQLNVELPLSKMFGYPTVAELAPVVEILLVQSDGAEAEVIPVVDREGDLPLSFAQERLWFLDQLEPGNAFYNMPLVVGLQGKLDVASLLASLKLIVSRHDSLRTHFVMHAGGPVQLVDETAGFEMLKQDISTVPEVDREQALADLIRAEALQPFDLETDSLVRAQLIHVREDEHVLLVTLHHIVSDGWSLGVLYAELTAGYAALSRGQQPELKALPVQYVDFAAWQRDWLSGEVLASQLAYWQQQLADLPTLVLPTDRPRPPVQTFNGAMIHRGLSGQLSEQLSSFSQQSGVSLYMTLLAAFSVLLNRYSGQQDIVVGSPIANRNRAEVENLIGFFVNSLVMRTDVSGNPDFRELVQRVNRTSLGAFDHQDLPFEKLVDELQPERDRSQNPLFQVMFALQNMPMDPLALEGLKLQAIPPEIHTTRFDLEVHIFEGPEFLSFAFIYNTGLFDTATIERLFSHYQCLLQGLMAAPDQGIADVPMLLQQEHQQLVRDWNDTTTDYPREQTVPALFEAQVRTSPDAIAVEYEGKTLTYAQLNARANQVAHYLQARGVGVEVRVGVFLDRSLEMIVALLGILKAGGAYVPVDLEYPSSRIAFMLEDAQVPVLLTTSNLLERLPDLAGVAVCLDSDWAQVARESEDNPVSGSTADSLAYVIYTSGSTGNPKGVEIPQRAINRLVHNTDYYQVDATDRIAQASNVSFDAATFEIWGALLNGAQLIGINKDVLLNSKSLATFLDQQGITAMFITTAVFNQIAREVPGAFGGLRGLMFGGEAVDCNAVR
ncbi:MAG: AMP-binding protein, partial [Gammaproteobacteria bacterium]|nr:AMP-binding protein [Gammaproteobacteria bacterium]